MFKLWIGVVISVVLFCFAAGAAMGAADGSGRLEGRVLTQDGLPHPGVVVLIQELGQEQLTDRQGRYVFNSVPAGNYTVLFVFGGG